jgi:hypothetical protein
MQMQYIHIAQGRDLSGLTFAHVFFTSNVLLLGTNIRTMGPYSHFQRNDSGAVAGDSGAGQAITPTSTPR